MAQNAGYFWNPDLSERKTGFTCPESPARCQALAPWKVFENTGQTGLDFQFESRDAEILYSVHDPDYVALVRDAHARGRRYLDAGETMVGADLFDQALLAASAGCEAMDLILTGPLSSAFCAVRPPGHHANRYRAFGFCVFNNVAVAAKYAQHKYGVGPVLIVDWDVHPGNGTQEIFWEDPGVFTLSFHQADLFPEAGGSDWVGEGPGMGFNRNVPFSPGTGSEAYRDIFSRTVSQVAREFRPELLVIAAGFDAHGSDPASSLGLASGDFAEMTVSLLRATHPYTGGKTLSILEGGYNIHYLRECVAEHFGALAGFPEETAAPGRASAGKNR